MSVAAEITVTGARKRANHNQRLKWMVTLGGFEVVMADVRDGDTCFSWSNAPPPAPGFDPA